VAEFHRGFAWFDAGTFDGLLEASEFVRAMQHGGNTQIACLDEIAWRNGWISDRELEASGQAMSKNTYGLYLLGLLEESN